MWSKARAYCSTALVFFFAGLFFSSLMGDLFSLLGYFLSLMVDSFSLWTIFLLCWPIFFFSGRFSISVADFRPLPWYLACILWTRWLACTTHGGVRKHTSCPYLMQKFFFFLSALLFTLFGGNQV